MTQLGTEFGALPGLAGGLEIEADDAAGSPGSSVIVAARVTNPGSQPVPVVLTVQGLAPSWCPPPQKLLLPAGNTTAVFLHLRPAPGTLPGRYLWALTAQTTDHPMQAATAQLLVRPEPPPAALSRRHSRPRRRGWILFAALAGALAAITAAGLLLTRADHSPVPKPLIRGALSPGPTPSLGSGELSVPLSGTILAGDVGPIGVTVVRLTLDDLSDQGRASVTPVGVEVTIKGKQWTASLPAGLYGMTFTQSGYEPESIVVDTTVARSAPPPWVQLRPISVQQEGSGD